MATQALYKIKSIRENSFDKKDKSGFEPTEENLLFRVSFRLDWNPSEKTITHSLVTYYLVKETEEILLTLDLSVTFYIDNYEEIISIDNGVINTPDNLLTEIFSITIATARGVIFAKTQGSYLSNVVLAAISPLQMLQRVKDFPNGDIQKK